MSDNMFLALVSVLFCGVLVGIYAGLRFLEERYRGSVEKGRHWFATYSVPVILLTMILIGLYQSQRGLTCGSGPSTAGWTCNLVLLLIPVLFISMSISYHYRRVYLKGRDLLALAGEEPNTWGKRWQRYSTVEIVGVIIVVLLGLLAIFYGVDDVGALIP